MLSFDGWSVGIAYCFKVVFDIIFSILVIIKAKENNIKLLYYPAIAMSSAALSFIPFVADFFHILFTGYNIDFSNLFLIYIAILLQIDAFLHFCLGINLTISVRKNLAISLVLLYVVFYLTVALFSYNTGFSLAHPPSPGETLIKPYFSLNSINTYFLIPYAILFSIFGSQILLKSFKLRGKVRLKYQMLALGYFFGIVWMLLVFLSQNVGIFYAIFFVASIFLIWFTFYYGLTPVREKKHKQKKAPSDVQLKFVSYLSKKSATVQSMEGDHLSISNLNRNILVFMSYATKDADLFKVKEISEKLTNTAEIKKVLYWQEDMEDNIIEYMNDNLGKCHTFILFCSKNALGSLPVKKEWTAADAMGKPIIPVFFNPEHIPPLLRSRLGIEFDFYDMNRNVQGLYSLILKKCGG